MNKSHCGCSSAAWKMADGDGSCRAMGPTEYRTSNSSSELPSISARSSGVSYLTDVRLDLSQVAHLTPGITAINGSLASVVHNCYGITAISWFCAGGNTKFDERTKMLIEAELKEINKLLAKARATILAGDLKGAVQHIGDAIRAKEQRVIPIIPGIEVDVQGVCVLPFFPIYDLFTDIDDLVDTGRALVDLIEADVKLGKDNPSLKGVIARLKVAVQELTINMIRQPWFKGDDAPDILDELKRRLEKVIKALQRFQKGGVIDTSFFGGVEALKKKFLDEISESLSLWDTYVMLKALDGHLSRILRFLMEAVNKKQPLTGRRLRFVLQWLELAEGLKQKLEDFIEKTPPDKADKWLIPEGPKSPKQPKKPEYQPGQEDLPPFPPPGYA